MKNKDTILKYLSDLMQDDEKIQFEERLKTDSKLKEEFDRVQASLNELSSTSNLQDDSSYFNNLVPKIHDRMESKKRKRNIILAPAISVAVTVLIIFFLQFPKSSEQNLFNLNISSDDLSTIVTDSDSFDVGDFIGSNFIEDYAYYNSSGADDLSSYLDDSFISEVNPEDIDTYYDNEQITNYGDFSNDDVDVVYEELINKKIL